MGAEAGITKIENPATGEVIAEVEAMGKTEVDAAVEKAAASATAWRAIAPPDRARLLRRFAARIDEASDELAGIEVANAGHVIGNARWEAGNVRDVVEYFAGAPERLMGRQIPVGGGIDVTFHEPIGIVGIIVPWNFPMVIAMWGIAPALAAGNVVLVKPAAVTPLSAIRLCQLAVEAGIPEGVLQILTGSGSVAGRRLVDHPKVGKICFTGSTEIGQDIMRRCADHVKRLTLELGGKSANIVFADATIAKAAASAPGAVFDNAGQDCCARSRILVQRSAMEEFVAHLSDAVSGFRVGDPTDEASQMGPLISADHLSRVRSFVPTSAEVLCEGTAPNGSGHWMAPTVLSPASPQTPVVTEEIFGPVAVVIPFEDEADAVALANDSIYGLSGSIWTKDLGRAIRVARSVETGALSVNSNSSVRYWTPFGGVKMSGLGRELGPDAAEAFTELKNVFIATEED